MLDYIHLAVLKPKELLCIEEDKVYVIVTGCLIMKSHEQDIHRPVKCAKFGEGDIINY